jgi:hypothetical protein
MPLFMAGTSCMADMEDALTRHVLQASSDVSRSYLRQVELGN